MIVHKSQNVEDLSPDSVKNLKKTFDTGERRPVPLSVYTDGIPDSLKRQDIWTLWAYQNREGRWTKVPLQPRGSDDRYRINTGLNWYRSKSSKPETWASFEAVSRRLRTDPDDFSGIGIMLKDGLLGVDLDNALKSDGTVKPWADLIVRQLATYAEVSPSGTGIKLFMRASFPELLTKLDGIERPGDLRKKRPFHDGEIEVYDRTSSRFFATTGRRLQGVPVEVQDRQESFEIVYRSVFREQIADALQTRKTRQRVRDAYALYAPSPDLDVNDEDLLTLARNATNGKKFGDLYDSGDLAAYGDDRSSGDLALCGMLAFWTGPDPDRIDRLYRGSSLMRPKWDEREDYREITIDKAVSFVGSFFDWNRYDSRTLTTEAEDMLREIYGPVRADRKDRNTTLTLEELYGC